MKKKQPLSANPFWALASLFFLLGMTSCKDIIEVDLSKKTLTGLAPAANSVSSSFTQNFRWDELEDATKYKLQIATPTFTAPLRYVLDTTIVYTNFSITLTPGSYEWRVRAENESSRTEYIVSKLTIDSTLDLQGQTVVLSSPADNYYSKLLPVSFSWQSMTNAENYLFQVLDNGTIIETQSLTTAAITYTFAVQGTYSWKITAQNSLTTSQPTSRTLVVDTTSPLIPVPFYPVGDTITANPIPLKWNLSSASNTFEEANYCQLQISTDATFNLITTKDTTIEVSANPMLYDFYGATVGQEYFWRIQSSDQAGNTSAYTTARRIKRN